MPRAIYGGRKFPTFTFESISTLTAAEAGSLGGLLMCDAATLSGRSSWLWLLSNRDERGGKLPGEGILQGPGPNSDAPQKGNGEYG